MAATSLCRKMHELLKNDSLSRKSGAKATSSESLEAASAFDFYAFCRTPSRDVSQALKRVRLFTQSASGFSKYPYIVSKCTVPGQRRCAVESGKCFGS